MAIYKKGTTQAQKIKSIIIIIVMVVLFSIPIYKIGKKIIELYNKQRFVFYNYSNLTIFEKFFK